MKKIYTQPRIETVATTPQQILCASGGIQAQISGYKQNTGGGFTQTFVWLAGAVCSSLLFLGTACSTTNNPDQPKPQAELKPRTLIVTEVESRKSKVERRLPQATITENGDVLDALWNEGDEVFYRNLSYSEDYYEDDMGKPLYGVLEADKDGSVASFSGERVWCAPDDQLALIYPKIDKSAIDVSLVESQLTASYTISVAGQDGSLATLANKYHHIYGIASVVSVTETTANAELAQMKSLMTVCKFSFEDETAPGTSLPISTLKIGYYTNGGLYDGMYPQDGTVSIAQNVSAWDVFVDPDWKTTGEGGKPLTIDTKGVNPTAVYVALFPIYAEDGVIYNFTVTSATGAATDGTYTGTATATLNEGEYVVAPLKLTKNN